MVGGGAGPRAIRACGGARQKISPREMNRMLVEMMQWESEWRRNDHISKQAEELRPAYRR